MNKKASEALKDNTVYLILLVLFFMISGYFIWNQSNGSAFYSDYYTKEISKIINQASPGDKITLDMQEAIKIARRNGITRAEFKEVFVFDNLENTICAKLAKGKKTCYFFFNDVEVINSEMKTDNPEKSLLQFEIIEAQK